MSRSPVDKTPKLRGEPGFWAAICAFGTAPWTLRDIESGCNSPRHSPRKYIARLEKAGFVELVEGRGKVKAWRRIKDSAEAPRLRADGSPVTAGRGTAQMWLAIRMLKVFTPRELALVASTEVAAVSPETAKTYVQHLAHAGYLAIVAPAIPGHRRAAATQARYRLIPSRYTGPKAPQIQRVKRVYDPNLRKVMWEEEASDV